MGAGRQGPGVPAHGPRASPPSLPAAHRAAEIACTPGPCPPVPWRWGGEGRGALVSGAVRIGPVTIGGGAPLALIAGPCVIESRDAALRHADRLRALAAAAGLALVY